MSHFVSIKISDKSLTNSDYLVKALTKLGWEVEYFEEPQSIRDFFNKKTQAANIIIAQKNNPGKKLYADVGFLKNPQTNAFELIVDSMNTKLFSPETILKAYTKAKIETEAQKVAKNLNQGSFEGQWLDEETYAIQFTNQTEHLKVGAIY